ncbi:BUD13 homolog isoform X2 [Gouania willdenowi]|uniref:BUD13 homolog isoform X2 n=1 Tax=Gouania willdenowi TaxID=441366 RepID=UPI0010544942|nr:BUD13 homolog isoform X2 [Gouania willdenowi]
MAVSTNSKNGASLSKAEYLKRYLSAEDNAKKSKGKIKKKRRKAPSASGLKIVDDDIDWRQIVKEQEEVEEDEEEEPVIAEVIDDRPEEVKRMEAFQSGRWKVIGADENEGEEKDPPNTEAEASSRADHDSPRKTNTSSLAKKSRHDSPDASPPRRKRHDSPDASPPRGKRHDSPDASPPRRKRNASPDASPPRRKRHDSPDASPPRRKRHDSPDASPPRRKRNGSPDASPPRRKRHSSQDRSSPKTNKDESRNTQTVFRDKSGKQRDLDSEREEQKKKAGEKAAKDQKYAEWGKGLAQNQMHQDKLEYALAETQKPMARTYDDEDLDRMLREREREGDPMAALLQRKKERSTKTDKPRYKGPPPPPNRFNIPPGYRWDGVDRSNGFEQKRYMRISDKKAVQEAAYKWSVEDM